MDVQQVALFIGQGIGRDPKAQTEEMMRLCASMGMKLVKTFYQSTTSIHPRTYIRAGKLQAIKEYVQQSAVRAMVVDEALSPRHMRNLENELKVDIYDRTRVILRIFLQRARSAQAKWQVQLAHYQYLLPRLTRRWTHLERQRGRSTTRGGAGEKELETDRRQTQHQITLLKRKLKLLDKQARTQRKQRIQKLRMALVGYTNAGKSTLMNRLKRAGVIEKDQLFSTVDTTVRKLSIGPHSVLLSDTVGFIHNIPHLLIEAFKSTLAEAREAHYLLHVVDASHPQWQQHIQCVRATLADIGAAHPITLYVFNKMERLSAKAKALLHAQWDDSEQPSIFISAHKPEDIQRLKRWLAQCLSTAHP